MARLLKWSVVLLVLFVAGWSAYWFVTARGQEEGFQAWLEQQRKQGWLAEASSVEVTGYPLDFRLDAKDLALSDPRTGWAWKAPALVAESRADTPTRIAVTWPETQIIGVPGDRVDINSTRMVTLLDLRPGPSMELREVSGDITELAITARSGWKAGADALDLNIAERAENLGPEHAYDLRLVGTKIRLPKEIVAAIDPTGWLRPSVDTLTVKGHAAFDDPLDRLTLEQGRMALRAMTIREAGFEWGDMRLVLKGNIEVDDDGYPVGEIKIEAREWRQMIRLAQSTGLIDREIARQATSAIEFVTTLTGSGDSLSFPLGLSGGRLRIGPFAVAEAPRLAPPR